MRVVRRSHSRRVYTTPEPRLEYTVINICSSSEDILEIWAELCNKRKEGREREGNEEGVVVRVGRARMNRTVSFVYFVPAHRSPHLLRHSHRTQERKEAEGENEAHAQKRKPT